MSNDCSIDEFALVMGVKGGTVYHWIRRGRIPSAYKNEKDCWRIPIDTDRPTKVYLPSTKRKTRSRIGMREEEIKQLKNELADLNKRHITHMEQYAGLLGRYDKLLLEWEIAKEDARAFERKYDDMKSQYDQLVLTISGLTLHEEGTCRVQQIASNATPKMNSPRRSRKRR